MKKILMFLFLLFSSYVFNNTTGNNSNNLYENYNTYVNNKTNDMLLEKINKMKREIYIQNLIQYIELESEIIIPDYIDSKYIEFMYETAVNFNLPIRTTFRTIYKESCFKDDAVSSAGALGLMQLMPTTRESYYNELRVDTMRLDKNSEDIYIGLYMMKDLYEFWYDRGNKDAISWKLCIASYNSGKNSVLKYRGIPPYKETQDFVTFILKPHSNPTFYSGYMKKYANDIKNHA